MRDVGVLKTTITSVLAAGLLMTTGATSAWSQSCVHPEGGVTMPLLGDLNGNGSVTVPDVLCAILVSTEVAAGNPPSAAACVEVAPVSADANCDGVANVSDVIGLITLALSGSVPTGWMADGSGCPAACEDCTTTGGSCLIASSCVPEGNRTGADGCQVCDPSADPAGWTSETPFTYYRDDDNDTYGVTADTSALCVAMDPYDATQGGDCDDTPSGGGINPGATEICDNGIDENCLDGADEGCAAPSGVATFGFSGSAQFWTVPAGINTVTAHVWAAGGGGSNAEGRQFTGGGGGYATGTFEVVPGETIDVVVGGGGRRSIPNGQFGAWPAGGVPCSRTNYSMGGGGGRSSVVRAPLTEIMVAGAGGGAGGTGWGSPQSTHGGGGGGLVGQDGGWSAGGGIAAYRGRGGTQSDGGAAGDGYGQGNHAGTKNNGGEGGIFESGTGNSCGGGGDGYYGGGAGGIHGGGGGGSGYLEDPIVFNGQLISGGNDGSAANTSNPFYLAGIGTSGPNANGGDGRVVFEYSYFPLGESPAHAATSASALLLARPGIPSAAYWLDPPNDGHGPFLVWCDMTTDGGGWALVHKSNQANFNDRTNNGYNEGALATATIDGVAILPAATIDNLGGTYRVMTDVNKKIFWQTANYRTLDEFINPGVTVPTNVRYNWTDPWETGKWYQNAAHGTCITGAGDTALEHICVQRWCCNGGSVDGTGIWVNGGTWTPGHEEGGTGWVR